MAIRVGINGGGRIGRLILRMAMQEDDVDVVAVNTHADAQTLAHLLKYDSIHGKYQGTIEHSVDSILIDEKEICVFNISDPIKIPWDMLDIDTVIESTGCFTDPKKASEHIAAGAGRVIITAPAKGNIPTIVMGVNDHILTSKDRLISSASCTTNCLAPMAKVLHENFEIEKGFMTTVHAYTRDQNLIDGSHRDLRRARAAGFSMVPTSTGAASAIGKVIPALQGKMDGMAVRVPTPNGSLVDFVALVNKKVSVETVHAAFREAASGSLKGILEYSEDPLVSADIIGNDHSCIYDVDSTLVLKDNLIKICGWYDNEWSYAKRCLDLIMKMATDVPKKIPFPDIDMNELELNSVTVAAPKKVAVAEVKPW